MLLVYISSSMHPNSVTATRQLSQDDVIGVIHEHYLVWAADARSVAGARASTIFRVPAFPYFAIVANTQEGIGVLAVRCGRDAISGLAGWLQESADNFGVALSFLRGEQDALDRDRELRAAQDAAVEESLRLDRERAAARRAEQQRQQEAERIERERREQEERAAAEAAREREVRLRTCCLSRFVVWY